MGSHTQWDRKLDGRLAQALMSIQAMKGVEVGLGFEMAKRRGSEVHDEIFFDPAKMVTEGTPRIVSVVSGMASRSESRMSACRACSFFTRGER